MAGSISAIQKTRLRNLADARANGQDELAVIRHPAEIAKIILVLSGLRSNHHDVGFRRIFERIIGCNRQVSLRGRAGVDRRSSLGHGISLEGEVGAVWL